MKSYWKLGCRWGSKNEGKPLFFDLLLREKIVISWVDKDFGNGNIVLLTDGFTPIGIAVTKSDRKPIVEKEIIKEEFLSKQIDFSTDLYYYDADIYPLLNADFTFDYQKGISRIWSNNALTDINRNLNELISSSKMNDIIGLLKYKKQIILQGPPGTGKTRLAKELADHIIKSNFVDNKTIPIKNLTKDYIKSNLPINQKIKGKNEVAYKVIGLEKNIVLIKSDTSKPWRPSYNKIIESFNHKLWELKGRTGGFKSYEDAIARFFYENHFEKIEEIEEKIVREEDFINIIQFHPSYSYEDFVRGIVTIPNNAGEGIIFQAENKLLIKFAEAAANDPENNYILVIDEINRANLSSVLGELIYALEYRGQQVESTYEVDGSNKLILPSNLYIIGTMNTADRSVGHIDYAIRRRFAFVDVLPQDLTGQPDVKFDNVLFNNVARLFDAYITADFKKNEVQLGHSYFIDKSDEGAAMDVRLKYEIIPILEEYIKDGILKEAAREHIKNLGKS